MFTRLADDSSKLSVPGQEVTSVSGKSRSRNKDPEDPLGEVTQAVSKNNHLRRTLASKATLLKKTQQTLQAEGGGSGGGSNVYGGKAARGGVMRRIKKSTESEDSSPASPTN